MTMTFEQAVNIVGQHDLVIDYPPRRRATAEDHREIYVLMADGTKRRQMAYVIGNFGILKHKKDWHVIHIQSENSIFETEKHQEAEALVRDIIARKIDTNWGYRDLLVFKSILQLIGVRKEHIYLSYSTETRGGSESTQ